MEARRGKIGRAMLWLLVAALFWRLRSRRQAKTYIRPDGVATREADRLTALIWRCYYRLEELWAR